MTLKYCPAASDEVARRPSCKNRFHSTCMDAESNIVEQMGNQSEDHYLLVVEICRGS